MTIVNNTNTAPITIITTCYGRNRHLYNLLSSLENSSIRPAEVIVVNDDADCDRLAYFSLNIIKLPTTIQSSTNDKCDTQTAAFDIGHNRNLGAQHAIHDTLIFLDVDCIVVPTFIEHMYHKLMQHPDALLMGQPRYLTRPLSDLESVQLQSNHLSLSFLNELSVYNPYRYNFDEADSIPTETGITAIKRTDDYGAFWSLCFAIKKQTFDDIGGFDTQYTGYGAEDTDFAFSARQLNIDFYLTADVIYHQQHSVYRPPLNHLDSIIINADRFYQKWQCWPMAGWLSQFADMGLIDWAEEQSSPIAVRRQPSDDEVKHAHCPNAPYV
ncbi:glycosyltransferase family 2 protein [Psychrobacter sp. T6-6]|uniref:glycosyltransferase family 2 protein n=1 Tax=unclassified Psychrobacter TaxID=196806 RepID=UPI0029BCEA99|nr:glycosyltransferase [Psychrobacter sp. PP-21]MDX2374494.1 glycosyltransferase [Psychrobacter sp. PP-21]